MAIAEREQVRGRVERPNPALKGWEVPKGKTIGELTRDATDQVIRKYGEALKKLQQS